LVQTFFETNKLDGQILISPT